MKLTVSVIIPIYNEARSIIGCLVSLENQSYQIKEVILIDDGSTDQTLELINKYPAKLPIKVLSQSHQGPGQARNLGSKHASGQVLVFVDGDMEFAVDFIEKLIEPIDQNSEVIGTFSKDEYLLNKESRLARIWNINLGRRPDRMHPDNYPDRQAVFRAILKSEFDKVGGFETAVGYTDDWTISRKLGVEAVVAPGAVFYHRNPDNYQEIWQQARWFGKNEFLTGTVMRRIFNLIRYNIFFALIRGLVGWIKTGYIEYLKFKLIYDTAVWWSVLRSFNYEHKHK